MTRTVAWLRRGLFGVWMAAIGGLIALSAASHLATTVVIQGGSMGPALPTGALAFVERIGPDQVRPGDVLTVRADNGVIVTHRVTRIAEIGGETYFELRGDANPAPDPVLVPGRALVGRVGAILPLAGYPAAMVASTPGVISVVALLAAVFAAVTWLEGLEAQLVGSRPRVTANPAKQRRRATVA